MSKKLINEPYPFLSSIIITILTLSSGVTLNAMEEKKQITILKRLDLSKTTTQQENIPPHKTTPRLPAFPQTPAHHVYKFNNAINQPLTTDLLNEIYSMLTTIRHLKSYHPAYTLKQVCLTNNLIPQTSPFFSIETWNNSYNEGTVIEKKHFLNVANCLLNRQIKCLRLKTDTIDQQILDNANHLRTLITVEKLHMAINKRNYNDVLKTMDNNHPAISSYSPIKVLKNIYHGIVNYTLPSEELWSEWQLTPRINKKAFIDIALYIAQKRKQSDICQRSKDHFEKIITFLETIKAKS